MTRKYVWILWYSGLLGTSFWAIFEFFYPRSGYYPGLPIFLGLLSSILLLVATGIPLVLFLNVVKRRNPKTELIVLSTAFIIGTIVLAAYLAPAAYATATNKSRIQQYINSIESSGFAVEYSSRDPFPPLGNWFTQVNTFENFTDIISAGDATVIHVHGGGELYFAFYVFPGIYIWAQANGLRYMYIVPRVSSMS